MKFSNLEIKDLTFAGVMISLAFAILLSGGLSGLNSAIFIVAFFTAGIGFLFHELMHKYVAQRYGFWAEFRASYGMLWLSVLFAFFGFIIAAPGAVYIHSRYGNITKEKNGKISIAGPITNLVLVVIFLIPLLIIDTSSQVLYAFLSFGLTINSLLAAFNMIPVMPLDGAKVIQWNKAAYYTTLLLGIGLFVLSFFV